MQNPITNKNEAIMKKLTVFDFRLRYQLMMKPIPKIADAILSFEKNR